MPPPLRNAGGCCAHDTLYVDSSPEAAIAGFSRPAAHSRLEAATLTGRLTSTNADELATPAQVFNNPSVFPGPLVLPDDEIAQDPEDDPTDEPEVTATPDATATPDGCDRGEGTDADYMYCGDRCRDGADGADYTYYCLEDSAGSGAPRPTRKRAAIRPLAVAQATTLPMTGGSPLPVALVGIGLLMAGAGIRVRAQTRLAQ